MSRRSLFFVSIALPALLIAGCLGRLIGDNFLTFSVTVQVSDEVAAGYSIDAPGLLVVRSEFKGDTEIKELGVICSPGEGPLEFDVNLEPGSSCSGSVALQAWIEPIDLSIFDEGEVQCGTEIPESTVGTEPADSDPQVSTPVAVDECDGYEVSLVIE